MSIFDAGLQHRASRNMFIGPDNILLDRSVSEVILSQSHDSVFPIAD